MRKKKRNKRMKIIVIAELVMLVAVLTVTITLFLRDNDSKDTSMENSSSTESIAASTEAETGTEEDTSAEAESVAVVLQKPPKSEVLQWYLKVVNSMTPLAPDYDPNLTNIRSEYIMQWDGTEFTADAVDALHAMFDAAKADGVSLKSKSSYRSPATQAIIYENKVNTVKNENQNLTLEQAKIEAAKVVAAPGTSEHALGLTVDINSVEESFENTEAFAWLSEHSVEYGFIMRYPKDKQDITKIIYEPWHYRYVTPEHAKLMKELNLCLEEYIEYLNDQ